MPPIPLLTGAYANLATEEWILQERQQIRSLYDDRLVDFHQSYVDDISWLNEYMTGLCQQAGSKGDILQAMKTPSRFQSVRKLNSIIDLKGVKPMGRLFSDSSVNAESSRTTSIAAETTKAIEGADEQQPPTTRQMEIRGSMIIHHDPDQELDHVEIASTGDSIDISEEDHEQRHLIEEPPQPLNEIVEVEEEDDEVVTVLKTPRAQPLHAKPNFPTQEDFLESPLAAKSHFPQQNEDLDLEGSDKENIPTLPVKKPITPRPSDRSDSYVTAMTSVAPDELVPTQEHDTRSDTPGPLEQVEEKRKEETIIETKVPVQTSPPEHQMQLPSLPTRAPLNMKKSFGVRKSQATSVMESIAGRASIIPNRKTFIPTAQPVEEQSIMDIKLVEPKPAPVEPHPIVTPVEERSNPLTNGDPARVKKDKDDTITIIDTELHLGDQRLKSKFTTESQRIHDALNSLRTKSTPGQPLRDGQERILEAETPAPVRMGDGQTLDIDEDEDWIPKKDYSSLAERLTNGQLTSQPDMMQDIISTAQEPIPEKPATIPPTVIESLEPRSPVIKPAAVPPPASPASGLFEKFENAAATAESVIRNAIAMITNPVPEPPTHHPLTRTPPPSKPLTNLYPDLTESNDNENFTIHYDDRASLDSRRDSTYFTQSEAPSQPSQIDIDPPQPPPVQEPLSAMPPPRKDQLPVTKPKLVPVSIRVPTASQRQKEQQKKALAQGTGIYPTLTQSRSVPDLATPGKLAREEARMSTASVQSTGTYIRGGGQIKALNAAKLAKQKEEQERERKALKKFEMDRKRQEAVQKRQEERKKFPTKGKVISKDEKNRPAAAAEGIRSAKKLPPSPQKKQIREETVKAPAPGRPAPLPVPSKGVKHPLEQEDTKPRTANYTAAGKPMGQPQQHGQDAKRRRTDESEDKEIITSKPMRVSVVKQDVKPTKSIGEPIRHPYTAEPKKGIKISSAHQHMHPAKGFMAPAEGVKFSNDPIPFGKPPTTTTSSQAKRSGPLQPPQQPLQPYPASESIILPEIDSEYSDSEDDSPKKPTMAKPSWAESPILVAQLKRQQMINPDDVFGEIKPPAIDDIFRNNNRRGHSTFRPRSSSANWSGQDKLTREEIEEYARMMGYAKP